MSIESKKTTFGCLIFPDAEELDFVGPWEMFTMWGLTPSGPEQCLIVAETAGPVRCAKGLSVNPHATVADCPPLDILLVPGGMGTRTQVDNPVLIDFIARRAAECRAVLSVCTGAFMLQRAGLLAGKRATTHWTSLGRLRAFPDVDVVEERIVRDGSVWTSAGISAGMDLALAFIASEAGDAVAGAIQLQAEYYPLATRYGDAHRRDGAPGYLRVP
jgi:transcriptional regulator GlxA family with amidase domain